MLVRSIVWPDCHCSIVRVRSQFFVGLLVRNAWLPRTLFLQLAGQFPARGVRELVAHGRLCQCQFPAGRAAASSLSEGPVSWLLVKWSSRSEMF